MMISLLSPESVTTQGLPNAIASSNVIDVPSLKDDSKNISINAK